MKHLQTCNKDRTQIDRKYTFLSQTLMLVSITCLAPLWVFGTPFYISGVNLGMDSSQGSFMVQYIAIALSISFGVVTVPTGLAMQHREFLLKLRAKVFLEKACTLSIMLLIGTGLVVIIAVPCNWMYWKRMESSADTTIVIMSVVGIVLAVVAVYFAPRKLRHDLEQLRKYRYR